MPTDPSRLVEDLYHSALKLDHSKRAAFLDKACLADGGLRREVESLIASNEQATEEGFLGAVELPIATRLSELIVLDDALKDLAAIKPQHSRLVELALLRRADDWRDRRGVRGVSRHSRARLEFRSIVAPSRDEQVSFAIRNSDFNLGCQLHSGHQERDQRATIRSLGFRHDNALREPRFRFRSIDC